MSGLRFDDVGPSRQDLLGATRENARPLNLPRGTFEHNWPLDTPWGRLTGPERIHLRDTIVAEAERRDPSGCTWTRDEKRAADEQEQEDDVAPSVQHAAFVPCPDACTKCGHGIDRGVEGPVCRRCAIRLAGLVLVSCLSPITPSRQKETA